MHTHLPALTFCLHVLTIRYTHLVTYYFFFVFLLLHFRVLVSRSELEGMIHACVSSVFTCLSSTLSRLQVVQNPAAKLLSEPSKRSHVTAFLHWFLCTEHCMVRLLLILTNFWSQTTEAGKTWRCGAISVKGAAEPFYTQLHI